MREIRTSGSMRGRRKRTVTYRACVLLYRVPSCPAVEPPRRRFGKHCVPSRIVNHAVRLAELSFRAGSAYLNGPTDAAPDRMNER